jgi:hypothetical protein
LRTCLIDREWPKSSDFIGAMTNPQSFIYHE